MNLQKRDYVEKEDPVMEKFLAVFLELLGSCALLFVFFYAIFIS